MEKILKQLFNAALTKTTRSTIAAGNNNRPMVKVANQFNFLVAKQKQAKATSSLKTTLKKKPIQPSLILNSLTRRSTFNFQYTNFSRPFSTKILSDSKDNYKFIDLLEEGNRQYGQGHYYDAIQSYSKVIALNPQDAEAFYNRGLAKGKLGQLEPAIADFDQAIALNPQDATAFYNRGFAKGQLGQLEAAIADFDQAIALNPQFADAFYYRGIAKGQLGQLEAAIADFDQAIAFNPQFADAFYNRGIAKGQLGQLEAAIADYDQAIALNPQDAEAFNNRGAARIQLGQLKAALADFIEASKLNPHNNELYNIIDNLSATILEQQNTEQNKLNNKPF